MHPTPQVFATIKDALAYSSTTSTLAGLIANNTALSKAAANPKTNITLFVSPPRGRSCRKPRARRRLRSSRPRPHQQ